MKTNKMWASTGGAMAVALLLAGCASPQGGEFTDQQKYGVGGAAVGGTLGAIVGNNVGNHHNALLGAAIGAALGGFAGSAQGSQQDQTKARLNNIEVQINTTTVLINNPNGSVTPVTLINVGNGQFKGPRGEIYNGVPSAEQLRPYYGMK
jgi:outer membrane lipoprotein SlyB